MKALMIIVGLCAVLAVGGCGGDDDSTSSSAESTSATTTESAAPANESETSPPPKKTKPQSVSLPPGAPPKTLKIEDLEKGTGAVAKAGDEVTVEYVGLGVKSTKEFDASWGREPFSFQLGAGQVITGWDEGVQGMRVGGRRQLVIPADLAYGAAGSPPAIGPNETLVFVIDLLSVE